MAPVKRKLTNNYLTEKCKAVKDLENGLSNKDVTTKYAVPRSTVSTWHCVSGPYFPVFGLEKSPYLDSFHAVWVKNKHKLTASLEKKGMNSSRKNNRYGNYEKVDKAICNWLVGKRSQKLALDGIIIKEKALEFAKALGVTEFKAPDCWLNNWKKRYNLSISINFQYFYKVFVTSFLLQKSLTSKALAFFPHHQD